MMIKGKFGRTVIYISQTEIWLRHCLICDRSRDRSQSSKHR